MSAVRRWIVPILAGLLVALSLHGMRLISPVAADVAGVILLAVCIVRLCWTALRP